MMQSSAQMAPLFRETQIITVSLIFARLWENVRGKEKLQTNVKKTFLINVAKD